MIGVPAGDCRAPVTAQLLLSGVLEVKGAGGYGDNFRDDGVRSKRLPAWVGRRRGENIRYDPRRGVYNLRSGVLLPPQNRRFRGKQRSERAATAPKKVKEEAPAQQAEVILPIVVPPTPRERQRLLEGVELLAELEKVVHKESVTRNCMYVAGSYAAAHESARDVFNGPITEDEFQAIWDRLLWVSHLVAEGVGMDVLSHAADAAGVGGAPGGALAAEARSLARSITEITQSDFGANEKANEKANVIVPPSYEGPEDILQRALEKWHSPARASREVSTRDERIIKSAQALKPLIALPIFPRDVCVPLLKRVRAVVGTNRHAAAAAVLLYCVERAFQLISKEANALVAENKPARPESVLYNCNVSAAKMQLWCAQVAWAQLKWARTFPSAFGGLGAGWYSQLLPFLNTTNTQNIPPLPKIKFLQTHAPRTAAAPASAPHSQRHLEWLRARGQDQGIDEHPEW